MSQLDIGKRIKRIRAEIGVTQEEFGKLIGIDDKSTISKYEKGILALAKKAEVELIATLGVNRDWLWNGKFPVYSDQEKFQSVINALGGRLAIMNRAKNQTTLVPFITSNIYEEYILNIENAEYIDSISTYPIMEDMPSKNEKIAVQVDSFDLYDGLVGSICPGDIVIATRHAITSYEFLYSKNMKRYLEDLDTNPTVSPIDIRGPMKCVLEHQGRLIFRLLPYSDISLDYIVFKSAQPSVAFPDIKIKKENIKYFYTIQTVIQKQSSIDKLELDFRKFMQMQERLKIIEQQELEMLKKQKPDAS